MRGGEENQSRRGSVTDPTPSPALLLPCDAKDPPGFCHRGRDTLPQLLPLALLIKEVADGGCMVEREARWAVPKGRFGCRPTAFCPSSTLFKDR